MPSSHNASSRNIRNIIEEIVTRRKEDIATLGWDYGSSVPPERQRGKPVPFIAHKGVVLEVKRASPSKGDIAPGLDAAATAVSYADAGADAISVLTERNYFKGSLDDLMTVCKAVDAWSAEGTGRRRIAVLRKDFIYAPEEVDVAYRAGADAVLLIARMLDKSVMQAMLCRCGELGMTAFVELRLEDDLDKLAAVREKLAADREKLSSPCRIVCGVNSRDLKDFSIDLLKPASLLSRIHRLLGKDCSVIFESGIRTPKAATFAGSLGFTGMLLGEAAARNPGEAGKLVSSFTGAKEGRAARKWLEFASLLGEKTNHHCEKQPGHTTLLKICGLTSEQDALEAVLAGADFLGFIFCSKSPRNVATDTVLQVRARFEAASGEGKTDGQSVGQPGTDYAPDSLPFLVGVVTDCTSSEAQEAVSLVRDGTLDFLQLHGTRAVTEFFANEELADLPHYTVVNVSDEKDLTEINRLKEQGEPRILIDAKVGDKLGGTGKQVAPELVQKIASSSRLWLAGGITAENVASIVSGYQPELIDVSSGIEKSPGKKDMDKLLSLCQSLAGLYQHDI
ncbi:MAG: bifunctional indole-3-glycerol phosphate synthase/phosphoribosylanthranilate isomerase [Treponema sp.]|nr:bifunctional indole-3-glycerol phosphate synthase/phosphoribosylanthranilate isomerase [Treponema sp.]